MACAAPLLLSLVKQSSARGVLLTCHVLVSPSMPGSLEAVTIDLHIPSFSQAPLKVPPRDACPVCKASLKKLSVSDPVFRLSALHLTNKIYAVLGALCVVLSVEQPQAINHRSIPGKVSVMGRPARVTTAFPANQLSGVQVAPKAAWLPKLRQLQWEIPELHSASELALRVLLPPEAAGHSAQGARAVVHLQGPPDETLSGLTLESGPVHGRLMEACSRLHGKAVATLE